jgi:hypothetical protein
MEAPNWNLGGQCNAICRVMHVYRVEVSITDCLRDYALDLEKYKAV